MQLLNCIELPKVPFRVLVTYWDCFGGGAIRYGSEPGWRALGEYAVSDASMVAPELAYRADNAQMLLDEPVPDQEILQALSSFSEPNVLDDLRHEQCRDFWHALMSLRPYCYFSYGLSGGLTFVARGNDLYKQFLGNIRETHIEAIYRQAAAAARAKTWQLLGPECGPELCIEKNCARLRIKLALRCFIHQLRSGST